MKKTLSILLASAMLFNSAYVLAEDLDENLENTETVEEKLSEDENTENQKCTTFDVTLSIKPGFCHLSEKEAALKLSDGEKEYYKSFIISDNLPSQVISFDVDEYNEGKTFYLSPEKEIGKLYLQGTEGTALSPLLITSASEMVEYIPEVHNSVGIIINGQATEFTVPARNIGLHVLVPFDDFVSALNLSYTTKDGAYYIETPMSTLILDNNKAYVKRIYNDKVEIELPLEPQLILDKLFVPISLFETAYNLTLIQKSEGDRPNLYVGTAPVDNIYVNSIGLSSQTDYLIWISKSEYKVRVFSGHKGNWKLINSFICGIGAPGTPTCEGTYRYYQSQPMWDYGSYYVGPIMRFNGGYAIHSTLIYKDGTPKDNRVGIRLSLGCIRLRPDDINWLHSIIPLYTTIHITG